MVFCGYKIWDEYHQESVNNEKVETIQKLANKVSDDKGFEPNWNELQALNSDICAYLYYPRLSISFPVAATNSNSYYLNHDLYKQYNIYGSVFLDKDCSMFLSSKNSIIYGHSIIGKNDGMFTTIKKLTEQNNFDSCNRFILYTKEQNYLCEIFSFQYTSIKSEPYRISFSDDEDFIDWITKIKSDSMYTDESIGINKDSRIVTLSTCADNGTNRYVVHAKMTAVNNIESSKVE